MEYIGNCDFTGTRKKIRLHNKFMFVENRTLSLDTSMDIFLK